MKTRIRIILHLLVATYLTTFCINVYAEAITSLSTYSATGVFAPDKSAVIAAKVMGRVETIPYGTGSQVSKGEVLLKLENAEIRAELDSVRASAALAKTELNHLKTQEARLIKLREKRSISEDDLESAQFATAVASEKLKMAEANIARVTAVLSEYVIRAPFSAVITEKLTEVGEVTSPGAPLLRIEDQSRLKFLTRVKEKNIPNVKIGNSVSIKVDALGDSDLKGTVHKIIPSADVSTHAFLVEITLPTRAGLYPGMFGKVKF